MEWWWGLSNSPPFWAWRTTCTCTTTTFCQKIRLTATASYEGHKLAAVSRCWNESENLQCCCFFFHFHKWIPSKLGLPYPPYLNYLSSFFRPFFSFGKTQQLVQHHGLSNALYFFSIFHRKIKCFWQFHSSHFPTYFSQLKQLSRSNILHTFF